MAKWILILFFYISEFSMAQIHAIGNDPISNPVPNEQSLEYIMYVAQSELFGKGEVRPQYFYASYTSKMQMLSEYDWWGFGREKQGENLAIDMLTTLETDGKKDSLAKFLVDTAELTNKETICDYFLRVDVQTCSLTIASVLEKVVRFRDPSKPIKYFRIDTLGLTGINIYIPYKGTFTRHNEYIKFFLQTWGD